MAARRIRQRLHRPGGGRKANSCPDCAKSSRFMPVHIETAATAGNGRFLVGDTAADSVFTREDLSEEQLLFGKAAEEFMRQEVIPREADLYKHDWVLTRELIRKAADRDLTRLKI